ncbi:YjbH domain-containing protein [Vineibacter terrae]|uniref:YjbH domain-containing protein n=1 Tax=Vineibacter terrae TaxID=2586908 RepID=A0A5C8PFJ5_9HYPH|nr:hypothetical protein [Vineibacter terrae]TXL72547.1 YjbH domain-containing protein [Vineibacter terrae]
MHAAVSDVISKAEFARRRNVSPGRVSQWISKGKIGGDALVGEGRSAQIREAVACAQLNRTLDVNQRYGNGLSTRLDLQAPPQLDKPAPAVVGDPGAPPSNLYNVNDQIARERLIQLQRANREAERQEAIDAGRLTDANAVRQQVGREIAKLVSHFEGALANFATALAAEFKVPQRDVLHLLRAEYRKFRTEAAEAAQAAVDDEPETVTVSTDDPIADDDGTTAA